MAYGHKTAYHTRMRAHVVLHTARGRSHARIARETGLHLDTVRTWRRRFAEEGISGLTDRKRSGRRPSFTALQAAQVKALAPTARRDRGAAVPLVMPGAGPRGVASGAGYALRRWLARRR
ncbi:helix-turn-helix domain-containing protein [Streptomyces sp. NPDC048411]|uniref:helix-turn-helix domain-containing protein n=1 Tax=Streptomyces sp. NPDC048411 TaxID=3157206 RepID=UPI0034567DD8